MLEPYEKKNIIFIDSAIVGSDIKLYQSGVLIDIEKNNLMMLDNQPVIKSKLFIDFNNYIMFFSFPLDTLKYRIEDDQGTCAVFDAFQSAWQILEKGRVRRPGVSQVKIEIIC